MAKTKLGQLTSAVLLGAVFAAPAGTADAAGTLEAGNKKAAQCVACHGKDAEGNSFQISTGY